MSHSCHKMNGFTDTCSLVYVFVVKIYTFPRNLCILGIFFIYPILLFLVCSPLILLALTVLFRPSCSFTNSLIHLYLSTHSLHKLLLEERFTSNWDRGSLSQGKFCGSIDFQLAHGNGTLTMEMVWKYIPGQMREIL